MGIDLVFRGENMNLYDQLFLQALSAALKGEKVKWIEDIDKADWIAMFRQAQNQHVLPMIYDAVIESLAYGKIEEELKAHFRRLAIGQITQQMLKTNAFLDMIGQMEAAGYKPLIVKGLICRNLYPQPDYRISNDEDILVLPEQFSDCCRWLENYGMEKMCPEKESVAYEISYVMPQSLLYVELHQSLFSPDSQAFGDWNQYFSGVHNRKMSENIGNHEIYTLDVTDHMFYLICHGFKHFLHSGFGIRQISDMVMFANIHGQQIDWEKIVKQSREIRAESFCTAVFSIGEKYLHFDRERAHFPKAWTDSPIDVSPLLEDVLEAGVYGKSTLSRIHSSRITLHAVAGQKKGRKAKVDILPALFPPLSAMKGTYTYLDKRPYLLPAAWFTRLLRYMKEIKRTENNEVADSIQIGAERIELLRFYKVID